MQVEFTALAKQDLIDIGDYIARQNPARAASFVDELMQFCLSIGNNPEIYPLREVFGTGIRRTHRKAYLIYYRIRANTVRIEHIRHSARQDDVTLH